MKRYVFLLILATFSPFMRVSAQISEIEEVLTSTGGFHFNLDTSILRNYNDTLNVLMQYGYNDNETITEGIPNRSSFEIQNTATGDVTHIVKLPRGYRVNDFCFITLRKMDGVTTEDFCCFCGTRKEYMGTAALPNPGTGPTIYQDIYSDHGFAGFFSMSDAMNPNTSHTAKIRDVEKTKQLYSLVGYPETMGLYYSNQNSFKDNAVMDIIGIDDTINKPSCLFRVKFYPVYPVEGVHWDNNMRCNTTEVLTDITMTDNYVATVSHTTIGDSLLIRYSEKEDYFFFGGLELNNITKNIDFSRASIQIQCGNVEENEFVRVGKARICHYKADEITVMLRIAAMGYGGFFACRYGCVGGLAQFQRGAYYHCLSELKELIDMPANNATAFCSSQGYDYVTVLDWKLNEKECSYPLTQFNRNSISANSLSLQIRNGYEHLIWSGRKTGPLSTYPTQLMSQRGAIGGGFNSHCFETKVFDARPVEVYHETARKDLPIQIRYPYDNVRYPVTYVNFDPNAFDWNIDCIKR